MTSLAPEKGDRVELHRLRAARKTLTARSGVGRSGLCCSSRRNTTFPLAGSRHAELPARRLYVHLPRLAPGTLPFDSGDVSPTKDTSPSPLGMGSFPDWCLHCFVEYLSLVQDFLEYLATVAFDLHKRPWSLGDRGDMPRRGPMAGCSLPEKSQPTGHNRGGVAETPPLARTQGRNIGCVFHLIGPVCVFFF